MFCECWISGKYVDSGGSVELIFCECWISGKYVGLGGAVVFSNGLLGNQLFVATKSLFLCLSKASSSPIDIKTKN